MWKEFRDFLLRGNVIELGVAIVIGGAFTAVVTAFVADILRRSSGSSASPTSRRPRWSSVARRSNGGCS